MQCSTCLYVCVSPPTEQVRALEIDICAIMLAWRGPVPPDQRPQWRPVRNLPFIRLRPHSANVSNWGLNALSLQFRELHVVPE